MTQSTELQRQTVIQLVGRVLSLGLGLMVVAIMTRALGRAGFGQYTTVVAFLQFMLLMVGFGLGMTVGRELGRDESQASKFLGNVLGFRAATAAAVFALAPLVGLGLGYPPPIIYGVALTSLGFFAASLSSCLTGVFQAKLKSGTLVYVDLAGRLVLLGGVVWAAYVNLTPNGYLTILVVANSATCLAALWAAYRLVPFRLTYDRAAWASIWRTTWPIALTTTLNVIYFKADTVILSLYRPADDVALYGAAYNVLEVLLAVPAIVGGLVLPLMARAQAEQRHEETVALYRGAFDALLGGGLAVLAGTLMLGVPIMSLVAGANFAASGQILGILSLAILCSFVGNAAGYALFALNEQRKLIPVFAAGAVVGLVSYLVLIPRYSYWGAAWGTVIVEFLVNVAMIAVLWRLGLKPTAGRWPGLLLATVALVTGLALPLPLIGRLTLGVGLWLMALWRLKLIPRTEILTH